MRSFGLDESSDTSDLASSGVPPEVDRVAFRLMSVDERRAYRYRESRLASADYGFERTRSETEWVDESGELTEVG